MVGEYLRRYVAAVMLCAIAGLLSVKSLTNLSVILLLVPALAGLRQHWRIAAGNRDESRLLLVAAALTLPMVAVAYGEIVRGGWSIRALDSSARLMLCAPVVYLLYATRVNALAIAAVAAPIALMAALLMINLEPEYSARWANRYATRFVDPNTLGAFSAMVIGICLNSADAAFGKARSLFVLNLAGLAAGFWIILGAGSRAGLIAAAAVMLVWLFLRGRLPGTRAMLTAAAIVAVVIGINLHANRPAVALFAAAPGDVVRWFAGTELDTSPGLRLTMWRMSGHLILRHPLQGYGDRNLKSLESDPELASIGTPTAIRMLANHGAHNEFLAATLRSGLPGGAAFLALLLIPGWLFWKNRNSQHMQAALASRQGLCLLVALAVGSLSLELLTLKYAASGTGLLLALYCAFVIRESSGAPQSGAISAGHVPAGSRPITRG